MNSGVFGSLPRGPGAAAPRHRFAVLTASVTLIFGAPAATAADRTQSVEGELESVAVDRLKTVYLECSRAALAGRLSSAAIMQCSVVYEELKSRAFGGDFDKLLAWSNAQASLEKAAGSASRLLHSI